MQMVGRGWGRAVSLSGVEDSFQMTRDELEKGASGPPITHSLGSCLDLLSWSPQGITKTESSVWTFYKILITKQFQM